ncbi:hypothetical protein LCGC14_1539550 [marine sediment metagenome]|uniref:Uncharacterized protein n=1 Tax=marine sediment metagenome TaxID=412755 RepID=A0A0F9ITK9_9ZZZZ
MKKQPWFGERTVSGAMAFSFEEVFPKRRNRTATTCKTCGARILKFEGRAFLIFAEYRGYLCDPCVQSISQHRRRWREFIEGGE